MYAKADKKEHLKFFTFLEFHNHAFKSNELAITDGCELFDFSIMDSCINFLCDFGLFALFVHQASCAKRGTGKLGCGAGLPIDGTQVRSLSPARMSWGRCGTPVTSWAISALYLIDVVVSTCLGKGDITLSSIHPSTNPTIQLLVLFFFLSTGALLI